MSLRRHTRVLLVFIGIREKKIKNHNTMLYALMRIYLTINLQFNESQTLKTGTFGRITKYYYINQNIAESK